MGLSHAPSWFMDYFVVYFIISISIIAVYGLYVLLVSLTSLSLLIFKTLKTLKFFRTLLYLTTMESHFEQEEIYSQNGFFSKAMDLKSMENVNKTVRMSFRIDSSKKQNENYFKENSDPLPLPLTLPNVWQSPTPNSWNNSNPLQWKNNHLSDLPRNVIKTEVLLKSIPDPIDIGSLFGVIVDHSNSVIKSPKTNPSSSTQPILNSDNLIPENFFANISEETVILFTQDNLTPHTPQDK